MNGEILEYEINEQPDVIERLIEFESRNIKNIVREVRDSFDNIMIAARGTSDNAARYAKYLFGKRNAISVALAAPSLFTVYKHPPKFGRALVLAISQSGHSPDVISVVKEAKNQGKPTIAITNDQKSPLAEMADYAIDIRAGEEKAVAATKTYTTSLTALAMMSAFLRGETLNDTKIQQLPAWIRETLIQNSQLTSQMEKFYEMDKCIVISRGYDYATAFELSLKLKELTYTNAEPYSSADFMHGPIALLHDGSPVIVIAPPGNMLEDIQQLLAKVKSLGVRVFGISNNREILKHVDIKIPVREGLPDWLFPVVSIVPGQLMALGLARAKELDPDHPKGLKKVTETW